MKINEFADIDPTKENDLGFDVIGDMQVFMKNDPMFYRKQYYPTMAKLQDKLKGGRSPVPDDLSGMIDTGCKHYCNKFDIPKDPSKLLTKEEYNSLAEIICSEEMEALRDGEY
jgi:hypothetical protein|tara:strand:- start:3960 stop:4298 length:339 start_codon:yes stop_codon:yes gene_type:complete